ncbi:MAG: hypothetical protein ACRDKW_17635 [Actinomycetota bacterium]
MQAALVTDTPEAEPVDAPAAPVTFLQKEVAETVLLFTITVLTLGGYIGVVMAVVRVAS